MTASPSKKLKIAIVAGPFPSTSETFVLNHITAMIDMGHDVDVFSFGKPKEKQALHESIAKYGLDRNVTYLFPLNREKKAVIKSVFTAAWLSLLRNPLWFYRCFKVGEFGGQYTRWDIFSVAKHFMKERYDVIHCHFGTNAQSVCFLKDIFRPVKYVVTFHGYDIRRGLENGNGYYKELFKRTDSVIAICKYNNEKLKVLGCPEARIRDIYNMIDTEFFSNKDRHQNDAFTIVSVARLVEIKNLEFALRIIKALKEKGEFPVKYIIVGDGILDSKLKELASEYKINDCVEFKGALKHHEVKQVLDECDLLLLTSKNEGLPTVVLEAQSMEIPIVATDVGGLREAVVDGKTGYLIPLDDTAEALSRISQLMKSPDLRKQIGLQGRQFVLEKFAKDKIKRELMDLYAG